MRTVLQRVDGALAFRGTEEIARIGAGLVVFVGFAADDTDNIVDRMAAKLAGVRIFEEGDSKFGRSLLEAGGAVLTVTQFTLYADCSRGRRPNFSAGAPQDLAEALYGHLGERLQAEGVRTIVQCPFASRLRLQVDNWGPFTVILDSAELWANQG